MKSIRSILLAALSCLLVGCNRSQPPPPQSSDPIANDVLVRIGEQNILLADFEAELRRRVQGRGGSVVRTAEREALLQEMVNFESTYLRAKEAGFDEKPEISRQIKAFIVERFIAEQMKGKPELPAVSDGELADYYRANSSRYTVPEKVRFAVIQISFPSKATEGKKAEALNKAESVLAEARALRHSEGGFGLLAQRHSEDQSTRYLGGDAGWLARDEQGRLAAVVVDAAFALAKPGDLSPVIQTSSGYWLVKLIEKRSAGHRPLEEVAEAIRYQLAIEKRHRQQQEFHEAVTAGLRIEINHALLETIAVPSSTAHTVPPPLPGS